MSHCNHAIAGKTNKKNVSILWKNKLTNKFCVSGLICFSSFTKWGFFTYLFTAQDHLGWLVQDLSLLHIMLYWISLLCFALATCVDIFVSRKLVMSSEIPWIPTSFKKKKTYLYIYFIQTCVLEEKSSWKQQNLRCWVHKDWMFQTIGPIAMDQDRWSKPASFKLAELYAYVM